MHNNEWELNEGEEGQPKRITGVKLSLLNLTVESEWRIYINSPIQQTNSSLAYRYNSSQPDTTSLAHFLQKY